MAPPARPPVVTVTVGLPGSGKTTWARSRQVADPTLVLVCKDDLRALLHGGRHSPANERQVVALRDAVVVDAVARGRSVIVHDTNLQSDHAVDLAAVAAGRGAGFAVEDFTGVDIETCISRDAARAQPVGEAVIRGMWREHLASGSAVAQLRLLERRPADPSPGAGLPEAVLCDLDGTLALLGDRSPYDRSGRCAEDRLNLPVARILAAEAARGTRIVLMSGREDLVRDATVGWLDRHGVPWDDLWMRPTGDRRRDAVVKRELHDAHVQGRFAVVFVVDDRPQVVRMWREDLGLFVFDVNQTGRDF